MSAGKVLAGAAVLSVHATGTSTGDPFVGVRIEAVDTGDTALSGFSQAYACFCLVADQNTCIHLDGCMNATGQGSATVIAGTQVSAGRGNAPGECALKALHLYDDAGNTASCRSTLFGGTTDFAPFFGGVAPKIKLKP